MDGSTLSRLMHRSSSATKMNGSANQVSDEKMPDKLGLEYGMTDEAGDMGSEKFQVKEEKKHVSFNLLLKYCQIN